MLIEFFDDVQITVGGAVVAVVTSVGAFLDIIFDSSHVGAGIRGFSQPLSLAKWEDVGQNSSQAGSGTVLYAA